MNGILNSRVINKHDVEVNWNRVSTFVPLAGEIIVYDVDNNDSYERFKVGDGTHALIELPFMNDIITADEIDTICGGTIVLGSEVEL